MLISGNAFLRMMEIRSDTTDVVAMAQQLPQYCKWQNHSVIFRRSCLTMHLTRSRIQDWMQHHSGERAGHNLGAKTA